MSAKEFDEVLKNKLAEASFAHDPQDYTAMAHKLAIARRSGSSKKILFLLLSAAASIAFAFTIPGLIRFIEKPSENTMTGTSSATNTQNSQGATISSNSIAKENEPLTPGKNILRTVAHNHIKTAETEPLIKPEHNIANPLIIANENVKSTLQDFRKDNTPAPYQASVSGTSYSDNSIPAEKEQNNYSRKINISLGGGFNYGSSSQGYLLGASARKNLTNKLFIEGDLSYLNTNPSTRNSNHMASAPPSTSFHTVVPLGYNNNLSSLNYLQFSPVIGYHIHKKLSLGMGPDFQRLLQSSSSANTVAASDADKIAPDMDFGFIGKTEYSVSNRLKAGFLYREGLNNFLTNTNKYFDRNYFQVQVKFSLLIK